MPNSSVMSARRAGTRYSQYHLDTRPSARRILSHSTPRHRVNSPSNTPSPDLHRTPSRSLRHPTLMPRQRVLPRGVPPECLIPYSAYITACTTSTPTRPYARNQLKPVSDFRALLPRFEDCASRSSGPAAAWPGDDILPQAPLTSSIASVQPSFRRVLRPRNLRAHGPDSSYQNLSRLAPLTTDLWSWFGCLAAGDAGVCVVPLHSVPHNLAGY